MSKHDVPTVDVKGQDGNRLIINKSDYDADPSAWELFVSTEAAAPVAPPPAKPTKPAKGSAEKPAEFDVVEDAGRWYVVNKATGERAFDAAGYADNVAAWSAVAGA